MTEIYISVFECITTYLCTLSLHGFIEALSKKYGKNDFLINFFFGLYSLKIYQTRDGVKKIMGHGFNLGFFNSVFNYAHGLKHTINNYDSSTHEHKMIHTAAKYAMSNMITEMPNIMNKHFKTIISNTNESIKLHDLLQNKFVWIWRDFIYGDIMWVNDYQKRKDGIMTLLNKTFYGNKCFRYPIIGHIYSYFCRLYYRNEFNDIRMTIEDLCNISKNQNNASFVKYFNESLIKSNIADQFNAKKINDILIDNIFMNYLVYDFLYNHLLAVLFEYLKAGDRNHAKKELLNLHSELSEKILEKSLFFPLRIRQNKLTTYILNLKSAKLFFSSGVRMCVAYSFVPQIIDCLFSCVDKLNILAENAHDYTLTRSQNKDIQLITDSPNVYVYTRDYFKECLIKEKYFADGEKTKMYDIFKLYSDNASMTSHICHDIALRFSDVDTIIVPESKGYILAGIIANIMNNCPVVTIRDRIKIIGDHIDITYKRGYTDTLKTLTISENDRKHIEHKNVLFIDDGIASFGTTEASIKVIESMNGIVKHIITPIEHHYCDKVPAYYERKNMITTYMDM